MAADGQEPAPGPSPLALELAALTGQRDAAYATLNQLGTDQVRLVVIGLDHLCDLAENPRHPAQLMARKLLGTWDQVHTRMTAIRSRIVVASDTPDRTPRAT